MKTRSSMPLALSSILVTLAGPVLYMLLLMQPMLRRTGLVAWVLLGTGLVLAVAACARDRRWRTRLTSCVTFVLAVLWFAAWFKLSALPDAAAVAQLQVAPDFTLTDSQGRQTSLHESLAAGPVLLVFFRGHW